MDKALHRLSPLTESTFYVLLALKDPIHGYGIIKKIERLTNKRVVLAAGTLYGALQNLEKHHCIEMIHSAINKRKKEYKITIKGQELLQFEISRLQSMIQHSKEEGVIK